MSGVEKFAEDRQCKALAAEHNVELPTLRRYISAAHDPIALAQLAAESVEGTAERLSCYYGLRAPIADEPALAERHRHVHFAPLALFEIYLSRKDVAIADAMVLQFAYQA